MSTLVEGYIKSYIADVVSTQQVQYRLYRLGYDGVNAALPMIYKAATKDLPPVDPSGWQAKVLDPIVAPVVAGASDAASITAKRIAIASGATILALCAGAFLIGRWSKG
jgi:hypothetical protein